jgi:hypothetical protein
MNGVLSATHAPDGELVVRGPWKAGSVTPGPNPVLVSATRFLYRRRRYLVPVSFHAWRLRRSWDRRRGTIGLFTGGELRAPATYSLSVWRDADDLQAFLRAPEHMRLMLGFRERIQRTWSVSWEMPTFTPDAAWREGLRRLADARFASAAERASRPASVSGARE